MSSGKGRRIQSQRRDVRGRFVKRIEFPDGSRIVLGGGTYKTTGIPLDPSAGPSMPDPVELVASIRTGGAWRQDARSRRTARDRQLHRRFFYRLVKLFYLLFWPIR